MANLFFAAFSSTSPSTQWSSLSSFHVQANPRWHRADLGLQLWGGQRGGEGAAVLLWIHWMQRTTAVICGCYLPLKSTLTCFFCYFTSGFYYSNLPYFILSMRHFLYRWIKYVLQGPTAPAPALFILHTNTNHTIIAEKEFFKQFNLRTINNPKLSCEDILLTTISELLRLLSLCRMTTRKVRRDYGRIEKFFFFW